MTEKKKSAEKKLVSQRDKYIKELKSLIKDVPDEGLLFLIRQSAVLIHNEAAEQQNISAANNRDITENVNNDTISKNSVEKSASEKDMGRKTKEITKSIQQKKSSGSETIIKFEKGGFGKSVIMVIDGIRKTFGENEIIELMKLAEKSKNLTGGSHRIYEWLKNNRTDVLIDTGIESKNSDKVLAIYRSLCRK